MGAFALRRPRGRLLSPRAGAFGAGFLAFAIMLPTAGEARLSAHQLEIRKECSTQLPGRSWIRGAGPCKGQVLAPAVLPQRVFISGKLGAALAADLYCRTVVDRRLPIYAKGHGLLAASLAAAAADQCQRQLTPSSGRPADLNLQPDTGHDRGFPGRAPARRMIRAKRVRSAVSLTAASKHDKQ